MINMQHYDQADAPVNPLLSTPVSVEDSGLPLSLLEDMLARQLLESGVSDLADLSRLTALSSRLLETVVEQMRADARLEVLGPHAGSNALRYSLTDGGRRFALEARERSGYVGPAPITETHYSAMIAEQSVYNLQVSRPQMQEAYRDVVIEPALPDKLGSAIHSHKAIFIYGPAGTGKTFLCSKLIRLLQSPVYIPHAVLVGDSSIVSVFDASVHRQHL